MMELLTVQGLVKEFAVEGSRKVVHAVNQVDFSLKPGEVLGLVGESGSGKTTVGRCITGLETPTAGSIMFDGKDLASVRGSEQRECRKRIQMVFQDPHESLHPRMTVRETLLEPTRLWRTRNLREAKKMVEELAEKVGIAGDHLDAYRHQLGSGQKQRVALARALASEPSLIVLDEPTSALDPSARAQILSLLRQLRDSSSLALLFISHDLTAVMNVANRIAVMYLGRIVEIGPTEDVTQRPKHPYTRVLMDSLLLPEPDAYYRRLHPPTGEIPSPIDLPRGCYFYSRCPLADSTCAAQYPPLLGNGTLRQVACFKAGADSQ